MQAHSQEPERIGRDVVPSAIAALKDIPPYLAARTVLLCRTARGTFRIYSSEDPVDSLRVKAYPNADAAIRAIREGGIGVPCFENPAPQDVDEYGAPLPTPMTRWRFAPTPDDKIGPYGELIPDSFLHDGDRWEFGWDEDLADVDHDYEDDDDE